MMSDFLIYHIQYVTLAPHPDRNSLDDLFRLLDSLDVFERDRMLTWMYLAFLEAPATQETAETEEQRFERRYNKFEEKFRHTAIGVFEPFLVHGAVTYTLACLRECGDRECLDALIHKSQVLARIGKPPRLDRVEVCKQHSLFFTGELRREHCWLKRENR